MTPVRKATADQIFGDNKAPLAIVLGVDFADLQKEIAVLTENARLLDKEVKTEEEQAAIGKMILDIKDLHKKAEGIRETEKRPILDAGRELDKWFKDISAQMLFVNGALQNKADDFARRKVAAERAKAARLAEEERQRAEAERQKADQAKTAQGAANAEARAEVAEAKAERLEAASQASAADLARARVDGVTSTAKGAWVANILDYQAAIAPLGALGHFLKQADVQAALNSMAKVQKAGAQWPGVSFAQEEKASFRR